MKSLKFYIVLIVMVIMAVPSFAPPGEKTRERVSLERRVNDIHMAELVKNRIPGFEEYRQFRTSVEKEVGNRNDKAAQALKNTLLEVERKFSKGKELGTGDYIRIGTAINNVRSEGSIDAARYPELAKIDQQASAIQSKVAADKAFFKGFEESLRPFSQVTTKVGGKEMPLSEVMKAAVDEALVKNGLSEEMNATLKSFQQLVGATSSDKAAIGKIGEFFTSEIENALTARDLQRARDRAENLKAEVKNAKTKDEKTAVLNLTSEAFKKTQEVQDKALLKEMAAKAGETIKDIDNMSREQVAAKIKELVEKNGLKEKDIAALEAKAYQAVLDFVEKRVNENKAEKEKMTKEQVKEVACNCLKVCPAGKRPGSATPQQNQEVQHSVIN